MIGVLLLALIAYAIAHHNGFFVLPPPRPAMEVSERRGLFVRFLLGFIFFFAIHGIVTPILAWLEFCGFIPSCQLTFLQRGWTTLEAFAIAATTVITLSLSNKKLAKEIWGEFSWRNFRIGALCWFVSYPVMIVCAQSTMLVVDALTSAPRIEQVAVRQLREIMNYPTLFIPTVISLITIVPIAEELLFRGLLQNVLSFWLRRGVAIPLTAAIFAFFHYAPSQGVSNLELFISLFVLACFLGFLYERQRSLWASIALHATFNGVSVLLLLLT